MSKIQSKEAVMEKWQLIHIDRKVSVALGLLSASLKARKAENNVLLTPEGDNCYPRHQ